METFPIYILLANGKLTAISAHIVCAGKIIRERILRWIISRFSGIFTEVIKRDTYSEHLPSEHPAINIFLYTLCY